MLTYSLSPAVEAFSTEIGDALDFPVTLPLHQAHSTKVRRLPEEADDICGVDALITQQPGLRIGVKTADCVPILLYDEGTKSVAAIHSGWRGTVQNIIGTVLSRMREEYGTDFVNIHAVIGPCIHLEAFEVGDEVYQQFVAAGYEAFCKRMAMYDLAPSLLGRAGGEAPHIDLPAICRHQLESLGVAHVEVRPECTHTLHRRFYSARRLGKAFDRQRIYNCIMLKS